MSGHSKFSNIKHRKGQQDLKRSKMFLQISKQIMNALNQGGTDPVTNSTLKLILQRARQANMPKANIERILNKFKNHQLTSLLELRFGGYLKEGGVIMVECLTDNRNRTTAQLKSYFHRFQIRLDPSNCERLFVREQIIRFILPSSIVTNTFIEQILLTPGIKNYHHHNQNWTIICQPQFGVRVISLLKSLQINDQITTRVIFRPRQLVTVSESTIAQLQELRSVLNQDNDVSEVYHNVKLDEKKDAAAVF